MKQLAVDFDGVINWYRYGYGTDDIPMPDAREAIKKLLSQGWGIVIHSARDENYIKGWCIKNDFIELVDFNGNYQKGVSYWAKPQAKFYIDDRALRFTTWQDVLKYVL